MLRLWLSLAVDYDGDGPPEPVAQPGLETRRRRRHRRAESAATGLYSAKHRQQRAARQRRPPYTRAHGPAKAALKKRVNHTKEQLRANMRDAAPEGVVEWRIDFADVMLGGGFDVVIANPPYVRQEEIAPKSYKDTLVKQYGDAAVARSDLYCYFYARGLQLLRDGGTHVFVCSNSWLDVGYGAKLQEYLLGNAQVPAIYESALERQFATADINTIISVIRKADNPADGDVIRFVSLRAEFDAALADSAKRREITQTRAALRSAGLAPPDSKGRRRFVGDKWGGKYLRAPDIYHAIRQDYGDKLVRLGDVATVRFGIKTGANDFFYLTPEVMAEFGIESKYRRRVMTTPQESRSIAVHPSRLPRFLFMCHDDKRRPGRHGGAGIHRMGRGTRLPHAEQHKVTPPVVRPGAAGDDAVGDELRHRHNRPHILL